MPEEEIKALSPVEEALAEWKARKVQVLIDEEPHDGKPTMEELLNYLESLSVPTRVYVRENHYLIILRERVSREEYLSIKAGLRELSPEVYWSRKKRGFYMPIIQESEPEEEVPEVPVIVPGKGIVGTTKGGGLDDARGGAY